MREPWLVPEDYNSEINMKTKQILNGLIILLAFSGFKPAISQTVNWSSQIGGLAWDRGRGIVDKHGYFFIAGSFDGPWCYINSDTLVDKGKNNIFFAKYDQSGHELWAQCLGGDNSPAWTDDQFGFVYYDSISDCHYLAGNFWGPAHFGTFSLTSQRDDIFLAKYDPDGNCIWAKSYGGVGFDDCRGITTDRNGNIFMCGATSDVALFDSISVERGGFLAKFDSLGNCIWAKHEVNYESSSNSMLRFMNIKIISNTDILVDGCTAKDGILQIDTITINHPGLASSMICRFDGNGNIKWIKEGLSTYTEMVSEIGLDSAENIYFTGHFYDSIWFGSNKLVSGSHEHEMFLVKYDKNGDFQWAKKANATMAEGKTVVCDPAGNVYVTGDFSGFADFEGFNINSYSDQDMFLARYSPAGQCLGVVHAGGSSEGFGVTQDSGGNPIVTMEFMDTLTLGSETYISHGLTDILIAKYAAITGMNDYQKNKTPQLYIYANPSNGKCNIVLPQDLLQEENIEMRIYDQSGKLIYSSTLRLTSEKIVLNLPDVARGMYHVVIGKGQKYYSGTIVFE